MGTTGAISGFSLWPAPMTTTCTKAPIAKTCSRILEACSDNALPESLSASIPGYIKPPAEGFLSAYEALCDPLARQTLRVLAPSTTASSEARSSSGPVMSGSTKVSSLARG